MLQLLFDDHAGWFALPALVGTIFFVLRLVLLFVGGADADGGFDAGDVTAGDGDFPADAEHGDPGDAFKLLSVQSIAAFLMGFGWGGLGAYRGTGWDWSASLLVGVVAGAAMVWVLGLLLKALYDLQSSGNISIGDTIGLEGTVYVSVPGTGRGQVRLVVQGRQRIFNAVTEGEAIPSRGRVRVTRVNPDNTLTVVPV